MLIPLYQFYFLLHSLRGQENCWAFQNTGTISNNISAKAGITKSSNKNPNHKSLSKLRCYLATDITAFNSPDQISCPNGEVQCSSESTPANRHSVNDDKSFPTPPDPLNHTPINDDDADEKSDPKMISVAHRRASFVLMRDLNSVLILMTIAQY